MAEIVPAIIPESFEEIEEKVSKVLGLVDTVSVDITDGMFTPSKSWPFAGKDDHAFQNLIDGDQKLPHAEKISYEIDMMVREPVKYISDWLQVGAENFVLHLGSDTDESLLETMERIENEGKRVGVAITPSVLTEDLEAFLSVADFVQIMGSDKIGYNGVPLDERVYQKISEVKDMYGEVTISIDIGVNRETAPKLVSAGATKLVSGSGIYKSGDIKTEIDFYKKL